MERLRAVAKDIDVSVAQVAIAWVMARTEALKVALVPIVGTRRREQLLESLGALEVRLDEAQLAAIEQAVPPEAVAGARYPEAHLAHLDSEHAG